MDGAQSVYVAKSLREGLGQDRIISCPRNNLGRRMKNLGHQITFNPYYIDTLLISV